MLAGDTFFFRETGCFFPSPALPLLNAEYPGKCEWASTLIQRASQCNLCYFATFPMYLCVFLWSNSKREREKNTQILFIITMGVCWRARVCTAKGMVLVNVSSDLDLCSFLSRPFSPHLSPKISRLYIYRLRVKWKIYKINSIVAHIHHVRYWRYTLCGNAIVKLRMAQS